MIRINPQWPDEWVKAHSPLDSREMLKRCILLHDPCPLPGVQCKIHFYWDENGDLCVETWEKDRRRLMDYIKKEVIDCGLCRKDGRRADAGRRRGPYRAATKARRRTRT